MKAVNVWLSRVLIASLLAGSAVAVEGSTAIAAQSAAQNDYQNHAYKSSIEYVVQNRLMWLYGDGNFYPEKPVTQADLIASLVSLQQLQEGVDVPELQQGFWAKVYYERAKAAGMLEGVEIDPSKQLTREEFAEIVFNTWGKYRKGYRDTRAQYKIQPAVDTRILPARSGVFPNGVSTTLYDGITGVTRAEQAAAVEYLHIDYQSMIQGDSIVTAFNNSLRLSGGDFIGVVPAYQGTDTRLLAVMKDGKVTTYEKGAFRLKAAEIDYLEFSVKKSGEARPMALYYYTDFPNYHKYSAR